MERNPSEARQFEVTLLPLDADGQKSGPEFAVLVEAISPDQAADIAVSRSFDPAELLFGDVDFELVGTKEV